jgi:hypothetical protein
MGKLRPGKVKYLTQVSRPVFRKSSDLKLGQSGLKAHALNQYFSLLSYFGYLGVFLKGDESPYYRFTLSLPTHLNQE